VAEPFLCAHRDCQIGSMVDVIEPMAFDDVMFRVVALTLARSLAYGVGRAFAKSRRRGGRCDRDSAGVTGGG
jgi:hypothetical protein